MPSSCNHIRLLDQRYSFHRSPLQRRNALRRKGECRFLTPLEMCKIRRQSCQGSDFGVEKYRKIWMHYLKMEHPMHRKLNLMRSVYSTLLPERRKRMKSLRKCFKDQVLLLTVLRGFQTPQESMKEIATPLLKKRKIVQTQQKPLLQLFAYNKHTIVSQTQFQNRVRRTISQGELPKIRSQAPLNRSMSMNKSILKIYGIKD